MPRPIVFLSLLLAACSDKDTGTEVPDIDDTGSVDPTVCDQSVDADCDGVADGDDCDPNDGLVYPGATEIPYDGKDNDCAGDGDLVDIDGDGYIGEGADGDDCNDSNPDVHPDAEDDCYDAVDEDCDGVAAGYKDRDCDGDGYVGQGADATDCNDDNPDSHPDAVEVWYDGYDQDCDARSDYDADSDDDDHEDHGGTDCDDTDPETNGEMEEIWDGHDRDCDGEVDTLSSFETYATFYGSKKSADGWFGYGVDSVEDYDGDGIREIVAGGPFSVPDHHGYPAGRLLVLSPANDGTPSDVAHASVTGNSSAYLGWDVANVGDLDGDGYSEVATGAPTYNTVYVFSGSDLAAGGSVSVGNALSTLGGSTYIGVDLTGFGDVNGDGIDEVVAGSGEAALIGSATWVGIWDGASVGAGNDEDLASALTIISGSGQGGESVGGADFDGDGLADLIVATSTDGQGKATVVTGDDIALGGTLSVSDFPQVYTDSGLRGAVQNGWLDDIDSDGYSELVFSAPDAEGGEVGSGVVYVISGSDTNVGGDAESLATITILGAQAYGSLASLDHGGDFDGDGVVDLVVSDIGDGSSSVLSSTYVFHGADIGGGGEFSTTERASQFDSRVYLDYQGFGATSFDMDGDGDDDLALGCPLSGDIGHLLMFESMMVD